MSEGGNQFAHHKANTTCQLFNYLVGTIRGGNRILRVNLDETSLCLFHDVQVPHMTARAGPRADPRKTDLRTRNQRCRQAKEQQPTVCAKDASSAHDSIYTAGGAVPKRTRNSDRWPTLRGATYLYFLRPPGGSKYITDFWHTVFRLMPRPLPDHVRRSAGGWGKAGPKVLELCPPQEALLFLQGGGGCARAPLALEPRLRTTEACGRAPRGKQQACLVAARFACIVSARCSCIVMAAPSLKTRTASLGYGAI